MRIWNSLDGAQVKTLRGSGAQVGYLDFSREGTRVIAALADSSVRVWDVNTGDEINVWHRPGGAVYSAAFSPSGRLIAMTCPDGLSIVDVATGNEIRVLRGHDRPIWDASFSPDGSRIVTASEDKTVRIWDVHLASMSTKNLLVEACVRRLFGLSKLRRDDMRLLGYPDAQSAIDVCEGVQ